MITGDHALTASAIATQLGIMTTGDRVLTGAEVERMTDDELREQCGSVAFATMTFSQFTMIFSIRAGRQWFTYRFFTNRWLWLTIALVTTLTLLVMLVPAMQTLFKLTALSAPQWGMVIGLSIGVLLVSELLKLLTRRVK